MHQWLAPFTDEFVLDILDKVWCGPLGISSFIVSCRSGWCTSLAVINDDWSNIDFWSATGQSSSGTRWSIRLLKLLFILDMTLLSFASMNLLLQVGLILVATLLLLFSKLSSTTLRRWDSACFWFAPCWSSKGYFTVGIKLCCFLCLGYRSTKKAWFTPPLWVVEYWWLFWPVVFYGDHEYFGNAAYLGTVRIVL